MFFLLIGWIISFWPANVRAQKCAHFSALLTFCVNATCCLLSVCMMYDLCKPDEIELIVIGCVDLKYQVVSVEDPFL